MPEASTGAMQGFGGSKNPSGGDPSAGLILLYAEQFEALPAVWPLDGKKLFLGRDESQDICIPVNAVSRSHASLSWERGGWTLQDLGSTNGTLVDGHLVREARLESGQELRFGDAIFKFVEHDANLLRSYRLDGAMLNGKERHARRGSSLIGGYQMDSIAAEIERIAPSKLSVMLLGESGTGKEVAARELHRLSARRGGFFAINCAAIPGNLLESELFGFKRGAFSGADRDKPGLIRGAHLGTLLLDEIGDMPLEAQAKLLRVLQSGEVFPLGATLPEQVDVRFVCATHRDLVRLQEQGKFRQDLFARLNDYQVELPPLRERKEDIYLLVRTFLERHGRSDLKLSVAVMSGLLHYDWPYNVRELESCIKRSIALVKSDELGVDELPQQIRDEMSSYGLPLRLGTDGEESDRGAPQEALLRELLERHQGNVAAVGRELGKARMQVHRWLKRYSIALEDYR